MSGSEFRRTFFPLDFWLGLAYITAFWLAVYNLGLVIIVWQNTP